MMDPSKMKRHAGKGAKSMAHGFAKGGAVKNDGRLTDSDGRGLDEGDPNGPPVSVRRSAGDKIPYGPRDSEGRTLSEGDPDGPPTTVRSKAYRRGGKVGMRGKC